MNRLLWQCVISYSMAVAAICAQAEQPVSFENDVRPIFKIYCLDCHGSEEEVEGSLDLRLRRFMVQGGDSGPAIEPGNVEDSYLYQRMRDGEMPPRDKKPSAEDLDTIARWIAAGAPTAREEPAEISQGLQITPEERAFWAFQPVRKAATPACGSEAYVRTPIDALLLSAMRDQGLSFSPDADKRTLLRRATLDLTGLPPTPDEIAQFMADNAPDAYEKLIDRLLASPRYGERWGRHWLDVAGYADSEGQTTSDALRSFAYKYRDYVIRSFNAGKPFDQMIVEQLAGDELVEPPYQDLSPGEIEKLVATGFLRMAADGTGSGAADQELARNQVVGDTLKIVSASLLGLTVGCAQCHDHRHDPVLQTDYYRLRAVFEPAYDWKNWRVPSQRLISLYTPADREKAAEIEAEAAKVAAERGRKQSEYIAAALDQELKKFDEALQERYRVAYYTPADQRTSEQQQIFEENPSLRITPGNLYQYNQASADDLKKYDERMQEIRSRKPFEDFLRALTETPGQVPATYLFHRGDPQQPKDPVEPGDLTIATPAGETFSIQADDPDLATSGRRLAYARWLTSGKHPLVARVLVNRVWMHHFGRGLVATPADFGTRGSRPVHPELLDWLAVEFVEQDWDLKHLHRQIMLSTAYRQSSERDPVRDDIDADNRFLWRKPIQRLEAESIRDRVLATSGMLDSQMFGPPIPIQEDDVGQIVVAPGSQQHRRSVYIQVRRSIPVSILSQFDMPVMEVNCEKRDFSTSSTQSLMLMNSNFILEHAEQFARRVVRAAGDAPARQVSCAWELALAREPAQHELEGSLAFLARQVEYLKTTRPPAEPAASGSDDQKDAQQAGETGQLLDPELQALTNLCQVLMGCHEFLYSD